MIYVLTIVLMLFLTDRVWRVSERKHRPRNLFLLGLLAFLVLGSTACSVNTVQMLEGLIPIISGIIPIIAAAGEVVLPGEASAIAAGAGIIQAGLNALLKLDKDYQASPSDTALAKVTAAFNDLHSNLAQLEGAAQIKDPVTARKISGVIDGVTASLAMIESEIVANHPKAVAAAAASANS